MSVLLVLLVVSAILWFVSLRITPTGSPVLGYPSAAICGSVVVLLVLEVIR